jgi:hypothetical protein
MTTKELLRAMLSPGGMEAAEVLLRARAGSEPKTWYSQDPCPTCRHHGRAREGASDIFYCTCCNHVCTRAEVVRLLETGHRG